ncbi:MAG: hypothetical protein HY796_03295 [Elusimicrobia bacterium]|nr:hypothetical protein [Elusimicrobiota bacterium]
MTKTTMSVLAAAVLCGCASAPCWTSKGPACDAKCKDVLCADGLAEASVKSTALREETAENRARAKLLSILEARITQIMKDYSGPEGELVERAMRSVAKGQISGAELFDRYTQSDGSVRALVGINPAKFKKAVEDIPQVQEAARKFLRQRTDDLLKEAENK